MEFRLLGPLEVVDGERSLPLGGRKQRALLALLLLRANEVVSVDRLIDDLWGDSAPATAANTLQVYVSQLRKALGARELIETRPPGYALRVPRGQVDLERFETLASEGRRALADGRAAEAADRLREALALWRGPALADLAFEPWSGAVVLRLEELRLAALGDRIDADLALGRHEELVPELETLIDQHPLRERERGRLILALYRSGRQAEALEAYQAARRTLVEELGIEPSPALQRLEKAILTQDAALELAVREAAPRSEPAPADERSILLVPWSPDEASALLALAAPLARSQAGRGLIVVSLVAPDDPDGVESAGAALRARREELAATGIEARAAAFTSREPGRDVVRLVAQQQVDLVLLPLAQGFARAGSILAEAPCDVGLVGGPPAEHRTLGGPVLVAFAGAEHDWAALELGAWLAGSTSATLRLAGSAGGAPGGRDASWLLANASLVVQQFAGVATEPLLVPPGADGLVAAAADAAVVVAGLSERFAGQGLGPVRSQLAERSPVPVVLVRRGLRPGGLAPPASLTRFTWSLGAAGR